MKLSVLIASAVAGAIATPALAESGGPQAIDEKCYGVSARDVSVCGTDASTCAYLADTEKPEKTNDTQTQPGGNEDVWAYVPKGTCVKIYGGTLSAKNS